MIRTTLGVTGMIKEEGIHYASPGVPFKIPFEDLPCTMSTNISEEQLRKEIQRKRNVEINKEIYSYTPNITREVAEKVLEIGLLKGGVITEGQEKMLQWIVDNR